MPTQCSADVPVHQLQGQLPLSDGVLSLQELSPYSSGSDDDLVLMDPAIQSATPIIIQAQQALKQVCARACAFSSLFCTHRSQMHSDTDHPASSLSLPISAFCQGWLYGRRYLLGNSGGSAQSVCQQSAQQPHFLHISGLLAVTRHYAIGNVLLQAWPSLAKGPLGHLWEAGLDPLDPMFLANINDPIVSLVRPSEIPLPLPSLDVICVMYSYFRRACNTGPRDNTPSHWKLTVTWER